MMCPKEENSEDVDVYGQSRPRETESMIAESLHAFQETLDKTPPSEKQALCQAEEKCPELLTENFKLMFLRCETFDIDLSVKRYVKYWEDRLEAFGLEKAFEPLTQQGALRDDSVALHNGFFRIAGKGVGDRSIIFCDPSVQDFSYPQESMLRTLWYMFHAALEDNSESQKRGFILICYVNPATTISDLDRKLVSQIASSIQTSLPVILSGLHFCRPPTLLSWSFPILQAVLGSDLHNRVKLHASDDVEGHEKYGLTDNSIPEDIGGQMVLDHTKWLEDRRQQEARQVP